MHLAFNIVWYVVSTYIQLNMSELGTCGFSQMTYIYIIYSILYYILYYSIYIFIYIFYVQTGMACDIVHTYYILWLCLCSTLQLWQTVCLQPNILHHKMFVRKGAGVCVSVFVYVCVCVCVCVYACGCVFVNKYATMHLYELLFVHIL